MHHVTLFNSMVFAQAQQGAGWQRMVAQFLPFIVLFIALYLLFIRPEQKRAKQHRELIQRVKAGDRVVTSAGIHGTVKKVSESTVVITVAENVDIEVERVAIASIREPASQGEEAKK